MIELLEFLIHKITGAKAQADFDIVVKEDPTQTGRTLMEVSAKNDIVGLIIGREGKTIKNIRKLLSVRAVLEHKNVTIAVNPREL